MLHLSRLSCVAVLGFVATVVNIGCFGEDEGMGPGAPLTYSLSRVDQQAIPVGFNEPGIEVTGGQFIWFTGGSYSFSYTLTTTKGGSITTATVHDAGRWKPSDDQSDDRLRAFLMKHHGDRYGPGRSLPMLWQLDLVGEDGSVATAVSWGGAWIAVEVAGAYLEFTR